VKDLGEEKDRSKMDLVVGIWRRKDVEEKERVVNFNDARGRVTRHQI
jgi:hypothetical protein